MDYQNQKKFTCSSIPINCMKFERGSRMNLNYWLKDNAVERMELLVIDKYISKGKSTAYYIVFDSNCGRLKNKVGPKKHAAIFDRRAI